MPVSGLTAVGTPMSMVLGAVAQAKLLESKNGGHVAGATQ
jgi:hypothetical protein